MRHFLMDLRQKRGKTVLLCLVMGGGGFHRSWDPCTQEIFSLLKALANEAERTLDLPKH